MSVISTPTSNFKRNQFKIVEVIQILLTSSLTFLNDLYGVLDLARDEKGTNEFVVKKKN